jgi:peptidoglycan/LPS O-acetylase OafA/YrhL
VVPAWSLVVEEWFYLLLPWVKKYLKQGLDLALMLIGSMLLARVWLVFGGKIGLPTENYFLFRSPVANFNYFFTGIAVAYVLKRIPELKSGEWLRGARGHFFDFLAVITFLGPVLKVFFHTELSCALVLISALSSQGFLSKVFKWKPLCWVGRRCYAVYIAQAFLEDWTLGLKERLGMHFHLSENSLQIFWFPIFLMLVLTFAELSRNYWEQPWQEFGRRFVQRRKIKIADLAVN